MADIPDVIPGETITSEWGNDIRDGVQIGSWEVDGSTEVTGPVTIAISTGTDVATVNLTIPAHWASWKCEAYSTFTQNATGPGVTLNAAIRIDGTDQQAIALPMATTTDLGTVGGRRTGMTTTGSRAVSLHCSGSTTGGRATKIFLYARAVRTS